MSLTDDLYREIILEHFRNPRNQGRLKQPDITAEGANPFCGDEMTLTLKIASGAVAEVRAECKGCSISRASASMMTEAIQGRTLEAAIDLARRFKGMMLEGERADFPPELEDLRSLEGVKKYPVRIKCAILGWNTLLDGIEAHRHGQRQAKHVEGEEGAHEEPASAESLEDEVRAALKSVIDPELHINIVDLGLVYGVEIEGGKVKVTYTLTSPGCPLGPVIQGQIQSALRGLPWVRQTQVELVWTPPWDPHTMVSEEVKSELGIW